MRTIVRFFADTNIIIGCYLDHLPHLTPCSFGQKQKSSLRIWIVTNIAYPVPTADTLGPVFLFSLFESSIWAPKGFTFTSCMFWCISCYYLLLVALEFIPPSLFNPFVSRLPCLCCVTDTSELGCWELACSRKSEEKQIKCI